MDVMIWRRRAFIRLLLLALFGLMVAPSAGFTQTGADAGTVKAVFLYNFAKFAEWPALPPGFPIVACIVGDDAIAATFANTVHGQSIGGHTLEVRRPQDSATWRACHVLFVADAETRRSAGGLSGIKTLPVLTVSDGKGFAESSGIIELFVEGGRMRFAINVDAAEHAGLHLSSRLLGVAKIVRNAHVQ
jgi:YfiR/HmsC-like